MKNIDWTNTLFLSGTLLTTLAGVPIYTWIFGLDVFQILLFFGFFAATGLSITLGYHRLFSHLTFHASLPVKLFTLIFGAAAFENSALRWCADHRRHHKFAGHDEDPYDIRKGFWHAHLGWMLFRGGPDTPLTWVRDLQKDSLIRWQHRHCISIGIAAGFCLPALIGFFYGGWISALGAFLVSGVARVVAVHHMTFCINSLCHWAGKRPYSSDSSARDSFWMALFTFGEGYHNFHHKFQNDYRNGVRAWHFDPTKWVIRFLNCIGMVRSLRTVPKAKILLAEIAEHERQATRILEGKPGAQTLRLDAILLSARQALDESFRKWSEVQEAWAEMRGRPSQFSRDCRRMMKSQLREASRHLSRSLRKWRETTTTAASGLSLT